jgi:hypothetical protein
VKQKNGKPNHPQTQGRAVLADPEEMAGRPAPACHHHPALAGRLHPLLQHPPPAPVTAAPPDTGCRLSRAAQSQPGTESHDRVRADRVDADGKLTLHHDGRLYHIGIGRTHARTRVLMLVHNLDVRVINAATGELIRELTLDPARNYQPTGRPPGPRPGQKPTPNPDEGSGSFLRPETPQMWS